MKSITAGTFGETGRRDPRDGRAVIARAFTLVEILISVAALALIAVGLATIFGAIGRTVTTGKSVSAYTSYAALIEQRMREDFANMSRDFPLVIRNELAYDDGNSPVPLYAGDAAARPRRIDEIIFGIKGTASSAREPLYPGFTARGDSSRIYYGHGQRRIEDLNPGSPYRVPEVDDDNADPAAGLGAPGGTNPNFFGSELMLLRHATVLTGPSTTDVEMPPAGSGLDDKFDNKVQVGLQPAASGPFRRLAVTLPNQNWPPGSELIRGPLRPQFPSGIIDAATSDFAEVRSIVNTVDFAAVLLNEADLDAALAAGSFLIEPSIVYPDALRSMHSWMDELFPTWSMAQQASDRVRMRYEPAAPDYFGPLLQEGPYDSDIKSTWGRADHVMLSSSNFLPRCSEFIVEWSFGKVWTPLNPDDWPGNDPIAQKSGTPVWHGMERMVPPVGGITVAQLYDEQDLQDGPEVEFRLNYRRLDGAVGEYLVTRERIHGSPLPGASEPVTSYFGYVDPQFNPTDPNNDGNTSDAAASSSINWAWPELIRVTISLADPNDPSIEQTFQFVFDAPGNKIR